MGLSKNITLTIKDYEIKLDKEIKFYENDTIDLCFSILEYGIEVKDGISINKLMPIQALRSYMLIETPHGIDYAESTKIEDNKIVFNLGTKYSQFVGIGRMQIVVKDSDGCRVTLPEFEFEIKESINMNWDRESFDFLATEDDSIIIDEFGRKIHMSKISDMPESENLSEESYAMIIDEEGNKRFKVRAIADAVEDSLDAKFNAYVDEINGDVEEFKDSVRTNVTTLTNENNTFKNQVNTSLADYGSDYNDFKDNVEARLGEHMTDYNRFKDGVETRIEEGESTYDGFVSDVSTVLDNYGSTYNAFKNEVNTANTSFRNTLNASNQAFKNEMVDRYDNFIYKIDEDIFEGGRTDYFGETHEKIGERLDLDFDVVHQRINDSGLMEYEGCSIMANNTYYGRQKDTVIKGRTLQNLAYNCTYNVYYNGNFSDNSTIERGNNFIKVTVNQSAGSLTHEYNYITLGEANDILFKDKTTYTFILKIDTNIAYPISVSLKNGSATSALSTVGGFVNGRAILTTDFSMGLDGVETHFIYLGVPLMGVGDYINVSDLIILEGDYTQTPLEELPFIEGIESAGDKSKNLCDNNDFEQGTVDVSTGVDTNSDFRVRSGFIKVEPNTTYMLTIPNDLYFRSFISYDDNKNFVRQLIGIPLTTNSNERFLKIILSKNGDNEVIKATDVHDVQLEKGSTKSSYKPYYDGYEIKGRAIGKNLAPTINANNYANHGNGVVEFYDGYCLATDKSGWASCYIKTIDSINVNPNVWYRGVGKSSASTSGKAMLFYQCLDNNDNIISTQGTVIYSKNMIYEHIAQYNGHYLAFQPHDDHFLYVKFSNDVAKVKIIMRPQGGETITNHLSEVMFTDFLNDDVYEPYKESTYSYILNEPLRSLPNGVCDEIDLTTGVLTRRVGKIVIDENLQAEIFGTSWAFDETKYYFVASNVKGLENLKRVIMYNNHICDNLRILNPYDNNLNCTALVYKSPRTEFRLSLTGDPELQVNDYINWLKENPLTFYFELEVPTTEQLTPQQLKSFDTTTHIISDNKLMPIVSTKIPTDLGAMVNTLSLRNDELEEINEQQDELIDITMMATDEMYSMLEPLMEAVEPMGLLDCSKMAQMYVAMVRRGIKKIEDVPNRYQEEVREALGIKIEEEEWGEDDGIK